MKYLLPTHVPITGEDKVIARLNAGYGEYHQVFAKMLRASFAIGVKKDARYLLDQLLFKSDEKIRKAALKHVQWVHTVLNIKAVKGKNVGHIVSPAVVNEWFTKCMWFNGVEYARINGVWYMRHWEQYTVDPQNDSVVIFFRDDKGKGGALASITDSTESHDLRFGRRLLKETAAIHKSNEPVVKKYRNLIYEDTGALREYMKGHDVVALKQNTTRNDTMLKLVQEILDISPLVVLAGPTTKPDQKFYQRFGYGKLVSLLQLAAAQLRNEERAPEIIDFDTRPLRAVYDRHHTPHTVIAFSVAQFIENYANVRKTVNE